ncbi:MAG: hypothetical protein WBD40_02605 [Tepidisphaeraceae bacterium]
MADTSNESALVDLGMVSLETRPAWRFFPMDDRVIGRPTTGVGVIQIMRVADGVVPPHPTHEQCMAAALAAAGYEREHPGSNRAKEFENDCFAGGESFDVGSDHVRVWYRCCPEGMLAAWYACPLQRAKERSVIQSMRECDQMVATLRLAPPVA